MTVHLLLHELFTVVSEDSQPVQEIIMCVCFTHSHTHAKQHWYCKFRKNSQEEVGVELGL